MCDVVVLGSLNMDLVLQVPRIPVAGETLSAREFHTFPGGKGANQSAAISRLGVSVAMVGRVGRDAYGKDLIQNLVQQGVDTSEILADPDAQTGLAFILVEDSGENRIMLISGANARLVSGDVDRAAHLIKSAHLLVCQLETLQSTVQHVIEMSGEWGIPVLLNPAPAYPLPDAWLQKINYLVLNETEAQIVSGYSTQDLASVERAGHHLLSRGVETVVITLGSQGALLISQEGSFHVPGFQVKPVDTTSAGDAFIGGFVAATIWGWSLRERVKYANACGAITVTRLGAQPSLPARREVESFLLSHPVTA